MNVVKELFLENESPLQLQCTEFNSELSSQAEVIPSDGPTYRTKGDLQCTSSVDNRAQPVLTVYKLNADQDSVSNEPIGNHKAAETERMSTFPPSFTQLLKNCQPADSEVKPTEPGQDLKTQFMRYLEGTSFKELLATVESVIGELGDEIVL
ncbi:hypothetical protein CDL12_27595 [Handroanthus impetiginosus]|uniref:Uncharacterized protein n=1 Tax=Handroanthus impetiginosus TaxID=429701 RepID=A0A2G9G3K3_9LAMI|nr:hypothetical protein CDL12_27595 [Handroanthus impetiginosus]